MLAREDVAAPFVVDDGTGRVRVEPADPTVDVETETVVDALLGEYRGGHAVFWAPDGLPHADGLAGFHARTDDLDDDPFREFGPFVLGTASRYVEGTLRTGDAVWVHGTVVERDADRGEPRVAVTGGGDARLVVFDRSPADRVAPILRRGRKRYLTGVGLLVVGLVTAVGAWVLL